MLPILTAIGTGLSVASSIKNLLTDKSAGAAAQTAANLDAMVDAIAGRLSDAGEELKPGDRIITGVLAPPHKASAGDTVRLELEALGGVELRFS